MGADVAAWPALLRPLVAEYGADRVNRIGREVLGFPPQWDPSVNQVQALAAALQRTE